MNKVTSTPKRKADHIRVNLEQDVTSGISTGLEKLRFEHCALPELHLDRVSTQIQFLGKQLEAPLLISSMSGGTEQAKSINLALAAAAQQVGVAMGLGSGRALVEDPSLAQTFQVRPVAPDVLLFANLGAVQLNYGYGVDQCQRVVDLTQADGLIFHLNPLQEALQAEGDVDFSDLLPKIERVCRQLEVPVLVKEVGWGISAPIAKRLVEVGVAAIDIAGAGGTSWSQVEMHRAPDARLRRLAAAFVGWGIPTVEAVTQVHAALPNTPLIASGGLRSGADVAKCLALGAHLGGLAGPLLKAAAESAERAVEALEDLQQEIRIVMFATGNPDIPSLQATELVAVR
jgi:isopentenyl-diphosphate delta-isomerase